MASSRGREAKKSNFVKDLLTRKPNLNLKAVNDAWRQGGNKDSISPSAFYRVKQSVREGRGEGASAPRPPGRPPGSTTKKALPAPRAEARPQPRSDGASAAHHAPVGRPAHAKPRNEENDLDEFETEIDDMIYKLKGMGGMNEIEDALRRARRLLVRRQRD
jgi:hypothetical protein